MSSLRDFISASSWFLERLASLGCHGSFWRVLLERVGTTGPADGSAEGGEAVERAAKVPASFEGLVIDEPLGGIGGVDMVTAVAVSDVER